jgi:hypothetical protein
MAMVRGLAFVPATKPGSPGSGGPGGRGVALGAGAGVPDADGDDVGTAVGVAAVLGPGTALGDAAFGADGAGNEEDGATA